MTNNEIIRLRLKIKGSHVTDFNLHCVSNEYNQETLKSHITDQPLAPSGRGIRTHADNCRTKTHSESHGRIQRGGGSRSGSHLEKHEWL